MVLYIATPFVASLLSLSNSKLLIKSLTVGFSPVPFVKF